MAAQSDNKLKKALFLFSISINTGLLFYFKYLNFFIENINAILDVNGYNSWPILNVVLPIGISFYTFESLTYIVDVYLNKHKPLTKFIDYQLYILLFPKLIAGPIIKYSDIADQITDRFKQYNSNNVLIGFRRFTIGLSKKVIIANTIGVVVDQIFSTDGSNLNCVDYWVGMFSYTFQLYFDFSGYSDMALGIGTMLGFNFSENFNNPYNSTSITDFWRRWHISLGTWMKNYLYIPLGGNQVNPLKLYFNLWIVFLISGFWHGAQWTFIIWGAYHGFFLVIERLFLLEKLKKTPKLVTVTFTFFIVSIGWVLFRSQDINQASLYIQKLFNVFELNHISDINYTTEFKLFFLIAVFFSFAGLNSSVLKLYNYLFISNSSSTKNSILQIPAILLFFLCISYISVSNFNPFIYFRF